MAKSSQSIPPRKGIEFCNRFPPIATELLHCDEPLVWAAEITASLRRWATMGWVTEFGDVQGQRHKQNPGG